MVDYQRVVGGFLTFEALDQINELHFEWENGRLVLWRNALYGYEPLSSQEMTEVIGRGPITIMSDSGDWQITVGSEHKPVTLAILTLAVFHHPYCEKGVIATMHIRPHGFFRDVYLASWRVI